MTAADALLLDICDDPAADDLRLIYADWMEQHGQEARAEFIRAQVELARMTFRPACDHRYRPAVTPPLAKPACPGCRYDKRLKALRRRERELLPPDGFTPPLPFRHVLHCWADGGHVPLDPDSAVAIWRRGFVDEVHATRAVWHEHGAAVCAVAPVTVLVLTDAEPTNLDRHGCCWWARKEAGPLLEPNDVPAAWAVGVSPARFVHAGATRDEALAWLARRALAWAQAKEN